MNKHSQNSLSSNIALNSNSINCSKVESLNCIPDIKACYNKVNGERLDYTTNLHINPSKYYTEFPSIISNIDRKLDYINNSNIIKMDELENSNRLLASPSPSSLSTSRDSGYSLNAETASNNHFNHIQESVNVQEDNVMQGTLPSTPQSELNYVAHSETFVTNNEANVSIPTNELPLKNIESNSFMNHDNVTTVSNSNNSIPLANGSIPTNDLAVKVCKMDDLTDTVKKSGNEVFTKKGNKNKKRIPLEIKRPSFRYEYYAINNIQNRASQRYSHFNNDYYGGKNGRNIETANHTPRSTTVSSNKPKCQCDETNTTRLENGQNQPGPNNNITNDYGNNLNTGSINDSGESILHCQQTQNISSSNNVGQKTRIVRKYMVPPTCTAAKSTSSVTTRCGGQIATSPTNSKLSTNLSHNNSRPNNGNKEWSLSISNKNCTTITTNNKNDSVLTTTPTTIYSSYRPPPRSHHHHHHNNNPMLRMSTINTVLSNNGSNNNNPVLLVLNSNHNNSNPQFNHPSIHVNGGGKNLYLNPYQCYNNVYQNPQYGNFIYPLSPTNKLLQHNAPINMLNHHYVSHHPQILPFGPLQSPQFLVSPFNNTPNNYQFQPFSTAYSTNNQNGNQCLTTQVMSSTTSYCPLSLERSDYDDKNMVSYYTGASEGPNQNVSPTPFIGNRHNAIVAEGTKTDYNIGKNSNHLLLVNNPTKTNQSNVNVIMANIGVCDFIIDDNEKNSSKNNECINGGLTNNPAVYKWLLNNDNNNSCSIHQQNVGTEMHMLDTNVENGCNNMLDTNVDSTINSLLDVRNVPNVQDKEKGQLSNGNNEVVYNTVPEQSTSTHHHHYPYDNAEFGHLITTTLTTNSPTIEANQPLSISALNNDVQSHNASNLINNKNNNLPIKTLNKDDSFIIEKKLPESDNIGDINAPKDTTNISGKENDRLHDLLNDSNDNNNVTGKNVGESNGVVLTTPYINQQPSYVLSLNEAPSSQPAYDMMFNVNVVLIDLLRKQIEYYFSQNNLVRDLYLRSNMDAFGFIPVAMLLGFKRIKNLTQNINDVISAISLSPTLELAYLTTTPSSSLQHDSQNGVVLSVRTRINPTMWPLSSKPTQSLNNFIVDDNNSNVLLSASPSHNFVASATISNIGDNTTNNNNINTPYISKDIVFSNNANNKNKSMLEKTYDKKIEMLYPITPEVSSSISRKKTLYLSTNALSHLGVLGTTNNNNCNNKFNIEDTRKKSIVPYHHMYDVFVALYETHDILRVGKRENGNNVQHGILHFRSGKAEDGSMLTRPCLTKPLTILDLEFLSLCNTIIPSSSSPQTIDEGRHASTIVASLPRMNNDDIGGNSANSSNPNNINCPKGDISPIINYDPSKWMTYFWRWDNSRHNNSSLFFRKCMSCPNLSPLTKIMNQKQDKWISPPNHYFIAPSDTHIIYPSLFVQQLILKHNTIIPLTNNLTTTGHDQNLIRDFINAFTCTTLKEKMQSPCNFTVICKHLLYLLECLLARIKDNSTIAYDCPKVCELQRSLSATQLLISTGVLKQKFKLGNFSHQLSPRISLPNHVDDLFSLLCPYIITVSHETILQNHEILNILSGLIKHGSITEIMNKSKSGY